jgi:hypothetical protein
MSINKLYFDFVGFVKLVDGIHPHLKCPVCSRDWTPKISLDTTFPATFDFNKKVSFTVPSHNDLKTGLPCGLSGQKIELFVAVHRDGNGVRFCIQKACEEGISGIPINWWMSDA